MPHPARQKAVAELGLAMASGDREARQRVDDLGSSDDAWERWLSLLALGCARDSGGLLAMLGDPSSRVRRTAWKHLLAVGSDEHVTSAIQDARDYVWAPKMARKALLRRTLPQLESWIAGIADAQHPAWVDVLPCASEPVVRRCWPVIREHGGVQAFRRLAVQHPELCAEKLAAALDAGANARRTWLVLVALPLLVERDPDAALQLVEAFFAQEGQAHAIQAAMKRLAVLRPAAAFDLLRRRQAAGLPARLSGLFSLVTFRDADRLGIDRLTWAVAKAPACLPEGSAGRRWVARLSAADRKALVAHWLQHRRSSWGAFLLQYAAPGPARDQAHVGWRTAAQDAHGVLYAGRLHDLPYDLRHLEARRHLREIEWLQARPVERCAYAAFLPFDEAKEALKPQLQHPEGAERAVGWRHLLATVRHDRTAAGSALAMVRQRKHEQDPVRRVMLEGVSGWSSGRIHDRDVADLVGIVEEALDAADLSGGTAGWAQRLAAEVLQRQPTVGIALLTKLLQVRGSLDGHAMGQRITVPGARRIDAAFAELASTWLAQERARAVLGLMAGLDTRLRHMPATLAAVDGLCASPHLPVLASLLSLLRRHARPRFVARALELLDADESVVVLPEVAKLVGARLTDRVDRFLTGQPIRGRFATGRTHWVIDFGPGVAGWTPSQQAAYAAQLDALLDDPERDVPTAAWALWIRKRLAWAPSASLIARASDPRVPVRDMAIRALASLDGADAVNALLDCMGDDRARIATYALRRALKERPQSEIVALLKGVPLTRVTVAKEVLRMMGELGGPGAVDHLVQVGQGELHRDVRIALMRALWPHMGRPDAWALVQAAATNADPIMAQRLLSIPTDRLSTELDGRLCALFAGILARPEARARLGFLKAVRGAPVRDVDRVLFGALSSHAASTEDPAEAGLALGVVLARMRADEVEEVVAALAARLPSRRHGAALLQHLTGAMSRWASASVRSVAEAILPVLIDDRFAAVQTIALLQRSRDVGGFIAGVEALLARGHLHHDAVEAGLRAVSQVSSPTAVHRRWSTSESAVLRRLALGALVASAAPEDGWTAARRASLRRLQGDEALDVAAAAAWVFPPAS